MERLVFTLIILINIVLLIISGKLLLDVWKDRYYINLKLLQENIRLKVRYKRIKERYRDSLLKLSKIKNNQEENKSNG